MTQTADHCEMTEDYLEAGGIFGLNFEINYYGQDGPGTLIKKEGL